MGTADCANRATGVASSKLMAFAYLSLPLLPKDGLPPECFTHKSIAAFTNVRMAPPSSALRLFVFGLIIIVLLLLVSLLRILVSNLSSYLKYQ